MCIRDRTYYHQREWLEFAGTWDAVPFLVVALGVAWTVVSLSLIHISEPTRPY
mgnify:CR=1 FL=1